MDTRWNAKKYSDDFSFVHQYGRGLLDMLGEVKGKSILDLGCGNGALTKELADLGAEVTGADASVEMLANARASYPQIKFTQADAAELSLDKPVDIVFSNAVLHWICKDKQAKVLQNIHKALKPQGFFVCEFGGYGCTKTIHKELAEVFAAHGYQYQHPFYFPTIGEYAMLLEDAGLLVDYARLFDRPTLLKGEQGMEDWLRMFIKRPFDDVPEGEVAQIIEETSALLRPELYHDGAWYADYVRIQFRAGKIEG